MPWLSPGLSATLERLEPVWSTVNGQTARDSADEALLLEVGPPSWTMLNAVVAATASTDILGAEAEQPARRPNPNRSKRLATLPDDVQDYARPSCDVAGLAAIGRRQSRPR